MTNGDGESFRTLLAFLDRLEQARIDYRLEHVRDSILIAVVVPGEHWEVEFFPNGQIEIERFRSSGVMPGTQELLDSLVALHGSPGLEKGM